MSNTFSVRKINELKKFFKENHLAGEKRKDCITTLNHAMKLLYPEMKRLGSEIDKAMSILESKDKVLSKKVVNFLNANGKITTGVTKPGKLSSSIWNTLMEMTGEEYGHFIFTLSVMDGYHSVTILLQKDKNQTISYWCDQTKGCEKMLKNDLDSYITERTTHWWSKKYETTGIKYKTRATIWRLKNN